MTGAWKGGLAFGNAVSIGATSSGASSGTSIPSAGSTFVKGAWTQLILATASDMNWLMVTGETLRSSATEFAVDIGVGTSGSEVAIVNNLCFSSSSSSGANYLFPMTIAAGTRIAARCSTNVSSAVIIICVNGFDDTMASAGCGSGVDTYGLSSSTNLGVTLDPGGTANTKGAYTTVAASTTNDLAGFMLYVDGQNTSTASSGTIEWLIDIAVGTSGSEQVILPNLYQIAYSNPNASILIPMTIYFPLQIGAATRIAARSQCSVTASPDRLLGLTLYGIRQ